MSIKSSAIVSAHRNPREICNGVESDVAAEAALGDPERARDVRPRVRELGVAHRLERAAEVRAERTGRREVRLGRLLGAPPKHVRQVRARAGRGPGRGGQLGRRGLPGAARTRATVPGADGDLGHTVATLVYGHVAAVAEEDLVVVLRVGLHVHVHAHVNKGPITASRNM